MNSACRLSYLTVSCNNNNNNNRTTLVSRDTLSLHLNLDTHWAWSGQRFDEIAQNIGHVILTLANECGWKQKKLKRFVEKCLRNDIFNISQWIWEKCENTLGEQQIFCNLFFTELCYYFLKSICFFKFIFTVPINIQNLYHMDGNHHFRAILESF